MPIDTTKRAKHTIISWFTSYQYHTWMSVLGSLGFHDNERATLGNGRVHSNWPATLELKSGSLAPHCPKWGFIAPSLTAIWPTACSRSQQLVTAWLLGTHDRFFGGGTNLCWLFVGVSVDGYAVTCLIAGLLYRQLVFLSHTMPSHWWAGSKHREKSKVMFPHHTPHRPLSNNRSHHQDCNNNSPTLKAPNNQSGFLKY